MFYVSESLMYYIYKDNHNTTKFSLLGGSLNLKGIYIHLNYSMKAIKTTVLKIKKEKFIMSNIRKKVSDLFVIITIILNNLAIKRKLVVNCQIL